MFLWLRFQGQIGPCRLWDLVNLLLIFLDHETIIVCVWHLSLVFIVESRIHFLSDCSTVGLMVYSGGVGHTQAMWLVLRLNHRVECVWPSRGKTIIWGRKFVCCLYISGSLPESSGLYGLLKLKDPQFSCMKLKVGSEFSSSLSINMQLRT